MSLQISKRLITVAEYHKMAEAGILEEDGIELINGEIIEMSPIGGRHVTMVNRLNRLLIQLLEDRGIISIQNPVIISDLSEPEPDIAILKFRSDFYGGQIPTGEDVLLLIEVADTSVAYDREIKMPAYAAAGIPESWIINLEQNEVEIFLDPSDSGYATREIARAGDVFVARFVELSLSFDVVFGMNT